MTTFYTQTDNSIRCSKTNTYFFLFFLMLCFSMTPFQNQLTAQSCDGTIYTNSNGLGNPAILDPNSDGRITAGLNQDFPDGTTELADFESLISANNCDCEIGWTRFEGLVNEPDADTQSGGSCNNTDIVSDENGGQDHAYYTVIDTDGDCSTTADLMIVYRIRVADVAAGTFSFEVLVNNDGLLADDPGETVVCCNKTINPGFEKEIQLATGGGNGGINVYDIDGIIGNNSPASISYPLASHSQVAKACGTDVACGSPRQPVFYTFMLPIDQLGYTDCSTALSNLNMVAVSSTSGNPVMMDCNSTADVGGADDNANNALCGGFSCLGSCSASNCDDGATLLCAAGGFSPPLPVEWVSFTAKAQNDKVELIWQTASEENNAGFEIERTTDGRNWENIGYVTGRGTISELQTYYFTDYRPQVGTNYYRLKQVDIDGKFEFSNIQSVLMQRDKKKMLEVFPNPSDGIFTLSLHNPDEEKALVKLFDSTGSLIWEQSFKEGNTELYWEKEFDLPQREVYFVVTQIGDQNYTQKVTVIDQ